MSQLQIRSNEECSAAVAPMFMSWLRANKEWASERPLMTDEQIRVRMYYFAWQLDREMPIIVEDADEPMLAWLWSQEKITTELFLRLLEMVNPERSVVAPTKRKDASGEEFLEGYLDWGDQFLENPVDRSRADNYSFYRARQPVEFRGQILRDKFRRAAAKAKRQARYY